MKHFAFFCALCALAVFAQPVLSAKGKPEEHIPVVNPFIGVWQTSGGEYWRFNIDGIETDKSCFFAAGLPRLARRRQAG